MSREIPPGPRGKTLGPDSVLIAIFVRYVVLGNFVSVDLALLLVVGMFDACHGIGFKRITFFEQLIDAFRISGFQVA